MKQKKQGPLDSDSKLSDERKQEFISVLSYFGMFQPEESYKVVCPFHADVNASMSIRLDEARWKCFGCERKGGAYELIKEHYPDKKPFEIYTLLAKIKKDGKLKAEKQSKGIVQMRSKKRNMNAVKDYYFNLSDVDWSSLDNKNRYKRYLRKRGFTSKILNDAKAKINESMDYPIIFPVYDNEVFRGYVCRTTSKRVEEKRKYLYNTGFRRANTLAGRYGDSDTVLVVEGFMDMLKAKQMGVKQVVAILGWKISDNQRKKLLRKGVTHIISGLDNDDCGRRGTKYLQSLGEFKVSRLHYPKGTKDFGDVDKRLYNERIKNQLIKLCGQEIFKCKGAK